MLRDFVFFGLPINRYAGASDMASPDVAVAGNPASTEHRDDPWEMIIRESRERAALNAANGSESGQTGKSAIAVDGYRVRGGDWTKIVNRR